MSAPTWTHRVAESVTDATGQIRMMAWRPAQEWCNFVLHQPTVLPAGLEFSSTGQIRPEAPPGRPDGVATTGRSPWSSDNRCSHLVRLSGSAVSLRIKQFLYDWAPPAWDHPSLWQDTPRGFTVGHTPTVFWIGTDYKGQPAASVTMNRTTIEIALERGTANDKLFADLVGGLQPVVPEIAARIGQTPLGELMYQRRHACSNVETTLSYWNYRRTRPADATVVTRLDPDFAPALRQYRIPPIDGFSPDSLLVFGDRPDPDETETTYVSQDPPYALIRLLRTPSQLVTGIPFPPTRYEKQPCTVRVIDVGGHSVHHAFLTETFGQHEAVWSADKVNNLLLVQPTRATTAEWFLGMLETILRSS